MLSYAGGPFRDPHPPRQTGINRTVNWKVYIILCADDSLYTGITTDIERRFLQHAAGRGARYFRGREPRRVVFLEGDHCRSTASRREMEIKKMHRTEKCRMIASFADKIKIDGADSSSLEVCSCTSG